MADIICCWLPYLSTLLTLQVPVSYRACTWSVSSKSFIWRSQEILFVVVQSTINPIFKAKIGRRFCFWNCEVIKHWSLLLKKWMATTILCCLSPFFFLATPFRTETFPLEYWNRLHPTPSTSRNPAIASMFPQQFGRVLVGDGILRHTAFARRVEQTWTTMPTCTCEMQVSCRYDSLGINALVVCAIDPSQFATFRV